ncbi:MAG: hypothetical protein ACRDNE_00560 [Gaiellaceae bacterium]
MDLTPSQRDQIRAGGAPRLTAPGDRPCPVSPGDVISVAFGLELVVERITRTRKGEHRVIYGVRDFQVRLPRRVPPTNAHSRRHLDANGMPAPLNAEEIARARREGATTSTKRLAVRGHDLAESVGEDDQNVITMRSRETWAEREHRERGEQHAREDARRVGVHLRDVVVRAARLGVDPTPLIARLEREIAAQEREFRGRAA